MADKFGRNYILTIQKRPPATDNLVVQLPFTIEFDVTRRLWGSANIAKVTIYNLAPESRNSILEPYYQNQTNRSVNLQAGYGNSLRTILSGNVYECNVQRVGTDYTTTIESFDGGLAFQNSFVFLNFPAGTKFSTIIAELAGTLTHFGVTIKHIDNFDYLGNTTRAYACHGNAIDRLKDIVGEGAVFIDKMQIVVKQVNNSLPPVSTAIPIISSESGLIGTPSISGGMVNFQMIFEPSLEVGQEIDIQSSAGVPQAYTGVKQITELNHKGTISMAVCGEAVTTITAYSPGSPITMGAIQSAQTGVPQ